MFGRIPFQSVSAGKLSPTVFTPVVALLHMHTLLVPLQICLAHKLLGAVSDLTGEWIVSLLAVRFHVCFEVVTAAEKLATSLDVALKVGFFLGCELSRGTPWAVPSA